MLNNGERQVAPDLSGIRRDHVARYEFAATMIGRDEHSVVDVACGIGYGAAVLADAGHKVLAIDRSEDAINYGMAHFAREDRIRFQCSDAAELWLAERFNCATCFETIEHLEDPLPMLQELCRSAPMLIASVPNEKVFPRGGRIKFHHRHYTRAEFKELLERAGYEVTSWWGQSGPFSDVEHEIEGRTLIAIAERARKERHPEIECRKFSPAEIAPVFAVPSEAKPAPKHVAIVGLGPSCATFFELTRRQGGMSAYCDEVWGINAIGDVLKCDRIFHMDDLKIQELRARELPSGNIAAMVKWLRRHPGPVYTSVVRVGYPGLVPFPLEEVLNGGYDTNGGAPYFNSTAAYAIALAIHIGVKHISLFGLDYTMPNAHRSEQGRACCEFWLGIAAARGIEISVPDSSSLLDACAPAEHRLYGYDCVDVHLIGQPSGRVEVAFTDRGSIPTAADIEARYDHSKHPNNLVRGKA